MTFNHFVSPDAGIAGMIQGRMANASGFRRLRRATLGALPFPVLESHVHDIVYANWVVPFDAVARHVPDGVTVASAGGMTVLTILTYRHGHFGPALAGPLRRCFPSPLQSNWRLYVTSIGGRTPSVPTVLFLANVFDSALYALGTRLFSDVMLAHHAWRFDHRRTPVGWVSRVDGGRGSAPGWELAGYEADSHDLPSVFAPFFADTGTAIDTLCLQDAAIAPIADTNGLARADISLPIDCRTVVPLTVRQYAPGDLLRAFGAVDTPYCFRVPRVKFRALSETVIA